MTHTLDQLLRFVEENDIKFIRLAFCDMFGVQKNIAIMSGQLRHAAEQGVSFDASAIPGFANVAESDLFLQPDLDTFALLPWRPSEGCVGRLFCDVRYPDGRPFEGDGRALLRSTEQAAAKEGYHFLLGPECEFYLFETDEHGQPTRTPFDQGGYFDLAPIDRGENVRRNICLTLEEMGIQPERSHHEQGPGQNEIDFRCASPLQAADDLMTVHTVVKAIAGQHGLFASFLPKPLPGKSGSGLHLNFSVIKDGRNLFENFKDQPDPVAAAFLAGILRRVPELTVFANPLPGSYQRLGCCEAPGTVSWSCQNRSSLVRVPAATGADCRMELRSPDPACNPYYVTALLLEAGMEGIRDGLPLPPAADRDLFAAGGAGPVAATLPASLAQAVKVAEESRFLQQTLPSRLLDSYLAQKRRLAAASAGAEDPHEYEMQQYFDRS